MSIHKVVIVIVHLSDGCLCLSLIRISGSEISKTCLYLVAYSIALVLIEALHERSDLSAGCFVSGALVKSCSAQVIEQTFEIA